MQSISLPNTSSSLAYSKSPNTTAKSLQILCGYGVNSHHLDPNNKGQDAGCISLRSIHPEFRPLGRFAPVAVNSGLRPETRKNPLKDYTNNTRQKSMKNNLAIACQKTIHMM